jgi:hypothetical protein
MKIINMVGILPKRAQYWVGFFVGTIERLIK